MPDCFGAAELICKVVRPVAHYVNESSVSKKTALAQKHIDECWEILTPIINAIPPDRYHDIYVEIMAAHNLLTPIIDKTRFPSCWKPTTWGKAQDAERQASIALGKVKVTSNLVKGLELDKKRKAMEERERKAAELRENEEKKRLAKEEDERIDALANKRLAEKESQRLSEIKNNDLTGRDRNRHANEAKHSPDQDKIVGEKQRAQVEEKRGGAKHRHGGRNHKSVKPVSRKDNERHDVMDDEALQQTWEHSDGEKQRSEVEKRGGAKHRHGGRNHKSIKPVSGKDNDVMDDEALQALQQTWEHFGVNPNAMLRIVLKVIHLKAAGKPLNRDSFQRMVRDCVDEKRPPTEKLPPDVVEELVAVMTKELSSLVIQAKPRSR